MQDPTSLTTFPAGASRANYRKPSIVEVISKYLQLRRAGKEYVGRCPFHPDKTPSFSVNGDKSVFYCHGCGLGGGVIRFIKLIEGVSFLEALWILGMRRDQIHRPPNDAIRRKAETVSEWANQCFDQAQSLLREIGQRARVARELGWREEVERCGREWMILCDLADDLQNLTEVVDLWERRADVEAVLLEGATYEPPPDNYFPPVTDSYRSHLQAAVRGEL